MSLGQPIDKHFQRNMHFTIYDCKWVPGRDQFVVLGMRNMVRGIIEIFEMVGNHFIRISHTETNTGAKCVCFDSTTKQQDHMLMGDFSGQLHMNNLNDPSWPVLRVEAHASIINTIDSVCGGQLVATGGRDGAVRVWDLRSPHPLIADFTTLAGGDGSSFDFHECWSVAFGHRIEGTGRLVAAGYNNGDVKLFDLRAMNLLRFENLQTGITDIEFDSRRCPTNKMVISTITGNLYVYDMSLYSTTHEIGAFVDEEAGLTVGHNGVLRQPKSAIWTVRHLPQCRDIFMACGGSGSYRLWKYLYPNPRTTQVNGREVSVGGTLQMVAADKMGSQPIHTFDWHSFRMGLGVSASFDEKLRVIHACEISSAL